MACGAENYPLSMGGPGLCPACDCQPPERRLKEIAAENRQLRAERDLLVASALKQFKLAHTADDTPGLLTLIEQMGYRPE